MDRPLKSNGFILKSACYEATIGRFPKSPIVYVPIPYTKSQEGIPGVKPINWKAVKRPKY